MARDDYLFDNQQAEAGERFDALSELFNPSTFQRMDAIGLSPGWRVWEVGAGGASVPSWIAARTSGYVLATDVDTSWLEGASAPYEVKRHDIGKDPAPDGLFDLVHARLVLVHVPERIVALSTMISAVRPFGLVAGYFWRKPTLAFSRLSVLTRLETNSVSPTSSNSRFDP